MTDVCLQAAEQKGDPTPTNIREFCPRLHGPAGGCAIRGNWKCPPPPSQIVLLHSHFELGAVLDNYLR